MVGVVIGPDLQQRAQAVLGVVGLVAPDGQGLAKPWRILDAGEWRPQHRHEPLLRVRQSGLLHPLPETGQLPSGPGRSSGSPRNTAGRTPEPRPGPSCETASSPSRPGVPGRKTRHEPLPPGRVPADGLDEITEEFPDQLVGVRSWIARQRIRMRVAEIEVWRGDIWIVDHGAPPGKTFRSFL